MFSHRALFGGGFVADLVISSNTNDYNIRNALVSAGWDGTSKVTAKLTINGGVLVGSTSTGSWALDTGTEFPAGSSLLIVNNGTIMGRGGAGGSGGGGGGGAGGPAFRAQTACVFDNNGTIAGGGAGGTGGSNAGGQNYTDPSPKTPNTCRSLGSCTASGGAGGAGAGSQNSGVAQGGSGGSCCGSNYTRGGKLPLSCIGVACGSTGGTGGSLGNGNSVNGNSFITWDSTGTRTGAIS
jgi:hypothetical protein